MNWKARSRKPARREQAHRRQARIGEVDAFQGLRADAAIDDRRIRSSSRRLTLSGARSRARDNDWMVVLRIAGKVARTHQRRRYSASFFKQPPAACALDLADSIDSWPAPTMSWVICLTTALLSAPG